MHPKLLNIKEFSYDLPDHRIAKFPLDQRDASKLLVLSQGMIREEEFSSLPAHLPAKSFLVFNNSRVIEARLRFRKPSGGEIEIFTLEPATLDISIAMQQQGSIDYVCLVGGLSKWKSGPLEKTIAGSSGKPILLSATLIKRVADANIIRFEWEPSELTFADILHLAGNIPIPPYLNRPAEASDNQRYQTIYADARGSVAAPTAGLHFTPEVLGALDAAHHGRGQITLHVGAGTFKPVKTETIEGHEMHAEFMDVTDDFIRQLLGQETVIPVGTTSMRTLESLYWMGVKLVLNPALESSALEISQWEIYDELRERAGDITKATALKALLQWLQDRGVRRLVCKTSILIAPGYPFKICKGIITNFHQSNSTLLLLIAALIGPQWKEAYDYALANEFRFLSYGDSSLLLP